MPLRVAGSFGLLFFVFVVGCQRAARYPAVAAKAPAVEEKIAPKPSWTWQFPQQPPEDADVPIVFIAHRHKDWAGLTDYWNHFPHRAAGMRTLHLGQSAFGMAGAVVLADR